MNTLTKLTSGDKLYHYTNAAALKGILEGEFWATEKGFLNDTMEFSLANNIFAEVLHKHMTNQGLCKHILEVVFKQVEKEQNPLEDIDGKYGYLGHYVISFSLEDDSSLMWSSYSSYVGYCIEFDYSKFVQLLDEKYRYKYSEGKVIYNREEQIALMERTIEERYFRDPMIDYLSSWESFDYLTEENVEDWYRYAAADVDDYNMFFKTPSFAGEKEYRFVFRAPHDRGIFDSHEQWEQHFRVKDEVLLPYIKVPLDLLESVERVTVGAKNNSDLSVKGVKYLFAKLRQDAVVEKSKISLRY